MKSVAASQETGPEGTIGGLPHPRRGASWLTAIEAAAVKRRHRRISRLRMPKPASLSLIICVLMALGSLAPMSADGAGAQGTQQRYTIISSDLLQPAHGWPAGRIVHCACYSRDDRIAVFRVQGDSPVSANLDQEPDFDGTFWLIDVGNRGYYQVAVRFYRDQGALSADYWQDHDGDGKVAVVPHDGTLQIAEKGFPSIRIVARDGYWQRNGRLAPNLDLFVDDRMPATYQYDPYINKMTNDGQPDVVIRVRGNLPNDPRSYDWRNVYTPISASSAFARSTLTVRELGQEPAYPPVFPWYLLGAWYGSAGNPRSGVFSKIPLIGEAIPPYGMVKPYNTSFAPIEVDWSTGRVATIGEFVASRGSDVNWFTYSLHRVEPDQLNNPDFESPFMFYDLAGDHDGIPELEVRIERMNQDDPYNDEPQLWRGRPYQVVRYSWDQTNTQNWSYKLGLLGQQDIDTTVSFPEFALNTIPYTALPSWVTQHRWDLATFAATDGSYWSTEGIYLGDLGRQLRDQYYTGGSPEATDPETMMEGVGGWRLDYNFHYARQPWLTFNPIDHELHLLGAQGGIWQIDENREVRFLNLSGGDTFDGWQLWDGDVLKVQLYRVPGGLLYSDATTTLYRAMEIPSETFHTLPPTTTEEWKTLGDRLTSNKRSFAPGDLRAMFDQFGGPATQIVLGPLQDFRQTPVGVRFAVDADTRRDLRSIAKLVGARPKAGLQVLSLDSNGWSLEPGVVALPAAAVDTGAARALVGTVAHVTIENPGTMDLTNAVMDVEATSPKGDVEPIAADEPVVANGGSHFSLDVPWTPTGRGSWTIEARVYRDAINEWSGERPVLVTGSATVDVAGAPDVGTIGAERMGWIGGAPTWPLVPLGCAVLVTAIAGAVLRLSRPAP